MPLEQPGKMGRVASEHAVGLRCRFGNLIEVDEIHAAHRFADPVGRASRGDREPDIEQCLADFGGDVMGSVLVPDDGDGCDLAIGRRSVLIIRFVEKGIHAFQYAFGHA